jgi:hypothetical protein
MFNSKVLYCTTCGKSYTLAELLIPEAHLEAALERDKDYFGIFCWGCDGMVRFAPPQLGFDFWKEA